MGSLAHLLLCHDAADLVEEKIAALREAGDPVALHVDARAAPVRAHLARAFAGDRGVVFAPPRRCGWGGWSLVEATIDLMRIGLRAFPDAGHFRLGSADCMPTAPAAEIRAALAPADRDWIEAKDFFRSGWIKTGLREERLIYRHYLNERAHPRLFYGMVRAQRGLGLRRRLPRGLDMRIGSQWWLLRRGAVVSLLALHDARPELARFFRRAWIPDECFLQSLASACIPDDSRVDAPPTRLIFSDYGQPVSFHADHEALLRGAKDRFFARKIGREDRAFRRRLLRLYARGEASVPLPRGAPACCAAPEPLYHRLRERGRIGLRAAPRPWERAGPGPECEVLAVAARNWRLGRQGAELLAEALGAVGFGPIFDDPAPVAALALRGAEGLGATGSCADGGAAGLAAGLGGLDRSLEKRRRAPEALLGAIVAATGAESLVFTLDPSRAALLRGLIGAGVRLRVAVIDAPCSEAWLMGHAERIGLWRGPAPPALRAEILRGLRAELAAELHALAQLGDARVIWARPGREARLAQEIAALAPRAAGDGGGSGGGPGAGLGGGLAAALCALE